MAIDAVEITRRHAAIARRREKWDRRFLSVAHEIATWSKDPSTQTGCVLVDTERNIISTGYNGFPRGFPDDPELYADREYKYAHIVHCDENALLSAARRGVSTDASTMYLTGPPCAECCKALVQAGVRRVVWPTPNKFEDDPETKERWRESIEASIDMLEKSGVEFDRVELE